MWGAPGGTPLTVDDLLLASISPFGLSPYRMMANMPMVPRMLAVDVHETKDAYQFLADVPGIPEGDVHVKLNAEERLLTITAERSLQTEGPHHRQERHYGVVSRTFRIPANADMDNVSAVASHGVLNITLAKTADTHEAVRKVPIAWTRSNAEEKAETPVEPLA